MNSSMRMNETMLTCLVIFMVFGTSVTSSAATADVNPIAVTQDLGFGAGFSSLSSSIGSDNIRAASTPAATNSPTARLMFQFPTTIVPSGSTIDGIELLIEGQVTGSAAFPAWVAAISNDGGTSFSFSNGIGSGVPIAGIGTDSVHTLGSPVDDWSGVTDTVLNNSLLRVGVHGQDSDVGSFAETFSVDDVVLRVYFTLPPGAPASSRYGILLSIVLLTAVGGLYAIRMQKI